MPSVKVVYCGGWGFYSRFRNFESRLESAGVKLDSVVGESTPGITGLFDVSVDGKLVYQKSGELDIEAAVSAVVAAVKA